MVGEYFSKQKTRHNDKHHNSIKKATHLHIHQWRVVVPIQHLNVANKWQRRKDHED